MSTFRYAIRTLIKSPGFSAIAIATIALGIAANTAIFSVVNGVLLRPLPFRDEARVVKVSTTTRNETREQPLARATSWTSSGTTGRSRRWPDSARTSWRSRRQPGEPTQLEGAWVTSEFFDVLGTPPALGRPFTRPQNARAARSSSCSSHAAWQQLFGDRHRRGRPAACASTATAYTVAAVMPHGLSLAAGREALAAVAAAGPAVADRHEGSADQSRRPVLPGDRAAASRASRWPRRSRICTRSASPSSRTTRRRAAGGTCAPTPIRENLVGDVRDALLVIQGAVGLVLLIACANVSSLLIARATGRRRELAIRAALGAGRGHLMRQLLAESLVLGVAGGIVGLLLSSWLVVLLVQVLPQRAAAHRRDRASTRR